MFERSYEDRYFLKINYILSSSLFYLKQGCYIFLNPIQHFRLPNLSGTISLQSTCNFVLPQMLFLRKQLYCFPKLCFSSASTGFPISSSSTRGARIGILLLVPSHSLPNFRNLSLPPFDSYLLFILKEHSHIQISV